MLKHIPSFKRNEFDNLLKTFGERKILFDFDKYCQIKANPSKTKDMIRNVFKFILVINKPINKISLEDLRLYLVVLKNSNISGLTKNDMRVHVKKFLKWKFKDWSVRFSEFDDIKNAMETKPKKNRSADKIVRSFDKPHAEIVKELIEGENKTFWKLFLVMNYEAGLRTIEVRTFEIDFLKKREERYVSILSMTKNKKEKPIVFSQRFSILLEQYMNERENLGIKSKFLFPSPKDLTQPISKSSVNIWFKRLTKRVLGKELFPYILRHMRGTDYDKLVREGKISLTQASQTMGHTEKVFKNTYSHTKDEEILDLLSEQLYGEKTYTKEEKDKIVSLEKQVEELKKGLKESLGMYSEFAQIVLKSNNTKRSKNIVENLKKLDEELNK